MHHQMQELFYLRLKTICARSILDFSHRSSRGKLICPL
jgi:hypothetical protein